MTTFNVSKDTVLNNLLTEKSFKSPVLKDLPVSAQLGAIAYNNADDTFYGYSKTGWVALNGGGGGGGSASILFEVNSFTDAGTNGWPKDQPLIFYNPPIINNTIYSNGLLTLPVGEYYISVSLSVFNYSGSNIQSADLKQISPLVPLNRYNSDLLAPLTFQQINISASIKVTGSPKEIGIFNTSAATGTHGIYGCMTVLKLN